jgi:hypothetical protein
MRTVRAYARRVASWVSLHLTSTEVPRQQADLRFCVSLAGLPSATASVAIGSGPVPAVDHAYAVIQQRPDRIQGGQVCIVEMSGVPAASMASAAELWWSMRDRFGISAVLVGESVSTPGSCLTMSFYPADVVIPLSHGTRLLDSVVLRFPGAKYAMIEGSILSSGDGDVTTR